MNIYGVDFTSAPKRDKPIVVAGCEAEGRNLILKRFLNFTDWPAYELWLEGEAAWIAGFDFPFGLPRRFVEAQGWPCDWPGMVRACICLGKERFAHTAMRAYTAARRPEDKHRQTDLVARSHSPLKTKTNPPVGLMFYEGAWRLLRAGVRIPGLHEIPSRRLAVEAYPGLAVRRMRERFYKNDRRATSPNSDARKRIVKALTASSAGERSSPLVIGSSSLEANLLHPSGDWLDAVLCAYQAHRSWLQQEANFGLPYGFDPREGWIATA